jgi:hypothetical protein
LWQDRQSDRCVHKPILHLHLPGLQPQSKTGQGRFRMPLAEQREQLREGKLPVGVGSYAHARVRAVRVYNS